MAEKQGESKKKRLEIPIFTLAAVRFQTVFKNRVLTVVSPVFCSSGAKIGILRCNFFSLALILSHLRIPSDMFLKK